MVKCDEKVDEVQIKTADVSSKFKFFETYQPTENEKKPFRITPPRDGVVKMPTTEDDENASKKQNGNSYIDASAKAAQRSSTTTKMLSVFRQMEDAERHRQPEDALKPLKCFTPPPDDTRRFVNRGGSESGSEYTDSEDEEDEEEDEDDGMGRHTKNRNVDEALQQAQAAARAKNLRAKFERWETKEIEKEQAQLYDGGDQSQVESTKS